MMKWNRIMFCIAILLMFGSWALASSSEKLINKYFTKTELKSANTAASVSYLSSDEKEFIQYTNLARTLPLKFANFYVAYLKEYDSHGYQKFKRRNKYYYGLFKDLKQCASDNLEAFQPDDVLYDYAQCWAKESGKRGVTGHNRRRCADGNFGECCSYMSTTDPMEHLMLLLIDEDIRSVGHRRALLANRYNKAGVSIQPHKGYGYCLVIDLGFESSNLTKLD